jgi:hypothetical protein
MQIQFTAIFRKVPEGYTAFVEELPGANTRVSHSMKPAPILKKQLRLY